LGIGRSTAQRRCFERGANCGVVVATASVSRAQPVRARGALDVTQSGPGSPPGPPLISN